MKNRRKAPKAKKSLNTPFPGLVFNDLRPEAADENTWSAPSGQGIRVRRVHRDDGETGVAVAWPTALTARSLYGKCPEPGRASADTDVIIVDPATGPQEFDGGIRKFLKTTDVDELITRFNTAHWSLAVWPSKHTRKSVAMVEFVGRKPDRELLKQLMGESITAEFRKSVPAIVAQIVRFESLTPTASPMVETSPMGEGLVASQVESR